MLLICPTAQARGLRQIGTTGKSLERPRMVSSEEQLLAPSATSAKNTCISTLQSSNSAIIINNRFNDSIFETAISGCRHYVTLIGLRIAHTVADSMAIDEQINPPKMNSLKRVNRVIWGLELHSWEQLMLVTLFGAGLVAIAVAIASACVVILTRHENAETKREYAEYKLTVDGKVADAKKEGIEAGKTASNALLRAAELEKEAAIARLETEKLKSVVQWRTFSASQIADIERVLSVKPGSVNLRWMDGDPEAMFLAIQLSQVMQKVHWSVAPGAVKPANGIIFGLLLPPEAGNDAEALRKALTAAKLPFSAVPAPQEGISFNTSSIPGAPFLYIGSRMPAIP